MLGALTERLLQMTAPLVGATSAGGNGIAEWLRGLVPESLQETSLFLENWQWIAIVVLVVMGVVIDRLVRFLLGLWLRKLLRKSKALRGRESELAFEKPVGILFMGAIWFVLLPLLDLPARITPIFTFAAQFVIAASGVWAAYRLVDLLSDHFASLADRTDTKVDDILVPMARRAFKIVVVAFGALFVAQNLDVDITSLLAGLGLGGLAFALAAKDTVENLFGSVAVVVDRPFHIGDWVVIEDGIEGTIEAIGFRSTRIRTFHNSRITVPNSRLVNASIDNLGERKYRRVKCMISVQYDTPAERIEAFCEGIRELIRRHPYTRKDYYMVYFNEFADSSLNILLYAFFETPDWPTELREKHRLFVDVVRLAERLGVDFAFPTQTLHVASVPPALSAGARDSASATAGEEPAGASGTKTHEEAIVLGRAEANAIVESMWPGGAQPPVSFKDPERIRPGNKSDTK